MSVRVKIKLSGQDAKKMATDSRIQSAFHEVTENTPRIVKHTERKFGAKRARKQEIAIALSKARAAGAKVPDRSGANYVSPNVLYVPAGAVSGVQRGGEFVPYRAAAGQVAGGAGEATGFAGAPNQVERVRQANNRHRDARTNLGRGKAGVVEVEG